MRRVIAFGLGLGVGMVVGAALVRRLDAAQARLSPDRLAEAALGRIDRVRERLGGGPSWTP